MKNATTCGRDARIHDEDALPSVEKRDAFAPGPPQIDVGASRLRISPRELPERERAGQDQRAVRQPEAERKRGRTERPDQLRGRQKDPDADRVTDDERRRGPEAELRRARFPTLIPLQHGDLYHDETGQLTREKRVCGHLAG
jgi:hypothetical protein